ncbi:amidohydrolase family protein [Schlesneria sp. T3-172]|uniref:amidohydrolase family protein n=1 Tax=Schlesneria sphaerica TaxID=3373610 RepID=UPI0037C65DC5
MRSLSNASLCRFTQEFLMLLITLLIGLSRASADDHQGYQIQTFAIRNARIVTAPGQVIERGTILVDHGRIAAVGPSVEIPRDADIIEGEGMTVYPGFIDAGATAFLDDFKPVPVEGRPFDTSRYALAGMRSDNRSGLTPEFSVAEHLKLAKEDLDKYRQAGFVAVHVLPSGRIASGQGAVIRLASLPRREALLSPSSFATFQLYERGGDEYPSTNMGIHAHLRQTFLDAQRHQQQQRLFAGNAPGIDRPASDPALDAFNAIRSGQTRSLFLADIRDDHDRALNFAAEHQLRIAIWGGNEAHRLVDRLKATQTDLILHVDFGDEPKSDAAKSTDDEYADLPESPQVTAYKRELWKQRIAGLAKLHQAGVRFGISSRDGKSPESLLKGLRQAIANGLSSDGALAALTTQPAAILGLDRELGTIAAGRPAYFIALTGSFDNDQSKVKHVVIGGQRYEYHKDAKAAPPTKATESPTLQVAGKWAVEIASTDAKVRGDLELTQSETKLSGRFVCEQGDGRITSGSITKDGLEFVVSIGAGDSSVSLKFESTSPASPASPADANPNETTPSADPVTDSLRPRQLQGTIKSPFGAPTTWTATRIEAPAVSRPDVQLSGIDTSDDPADSEAKETATGASALAPANNTVTPAAASSPTPASPHEQPIETPAHRTARPLVTGGNILIKDGTILTGTGLTLPRTSILIKQGMIVAIGEDLQPEPGITIIDATGRFVMPGIIDTHSHIMISNGMAGINEATASIVCEVRVRDVIYTADASEYRALAGGVTTARLLHGSANCIGGQDAVVQLKHGTTVEEHLYPYANSGVKFALGENVKYRGGRFPNTRLGVEATLNRAFLEALDYRRVWLEHEQAKRRAGGAADQLLEPRRDLRLEALVDLLDHQKFIHSHCYRADEILMLLRVAENHGIRVRSLQHVLEGYKVAPEIVKHGASCSTFADWWAYKVEAFDAVPHNAALLHEAGANVVIKSDDWELIRHLYVEAAKTVRYGNMPPDVALQAITLNPARELGLSDRLGSIEVGKQADIAIFSGHPLSGFSRCEQTLIAGEPYFIREKQPSVMSTAAVQRSAKPPELVLPKPEERVGKIDLSAATAPRFAIVGATLHPVDAADIPDGVLIVDQGKIVELGAGLPVPEGIPVLQATGLHVYPGLIDAGTSVGLIEIGKVRETSDLSEIGRFQADLRAGIAINPDSELIPVARTGGITNTLCLPARGANMTSHGRAYGAIIPGRTSLVQLAGWTMPEMVLDMESGLQLLWPHGDNRKQAIEDLSNHLKAARLYDSVRSEPASTDSAPSTRANPPKLLVDPRFEALRPFVRGEKTIYIEAETKQEITEALHFARKEKLKIVLCGVTDGWKVADKIKEANVPVIVGPVMRKPIDDFDPFDAPYANAGRLYEAGVKLCFRSDTASNSRNAPFEAAMAVAYGLPEAEALRGVTLSSAEILGAADKLGSITAGKQANLLITDGSPLQQTTQIKGILIQGQPYQPESRQTRFYEKYRARLNK